MANDPTDVSTKPGLAERIRLTLHIVRAHPTGRLALKVFIAALGGLVVAIGIVLIPLPGPGWLIVIGGLAIWAIEFVWARHLLQFTRNKLRSWTAWIGRQTWPVRLLIGAAGLLFIGMVAVLTLKYSFGVDIIEKVWQYITTH
ncbi:MAG TPA: TIGR02611 family protein [Micromonosporaceae bacterium]|nr:TIGR02611 family protein [Micromonosporaceae bacterium]HCU52427.1 TIGR02611 family protein [Micromonosporaceae bacterium]